MRFRGKISDQYSNIDGQVAALSNGYFLVVSGEVWHKYRCKAIVERARQSELCFASLPVTLLKTDREKYYENVGMSNHPLQEY